MTSQTSIPNPSVLVVHPEQQHSNQLAAALASAGLLSGYICGTPQEPEIRKLIGDHRIIRSRLWLPTRRIVSHLFPPRFRSEAVHRMARYSDRRIARKLKVIRPDAVVAYENCALETFEAAKRLGIVRILDVPSVHHRMQARVGLSRMRAKFQQEVDVRKDREIALADLILVCSSLARDSFTEAGIASSRVAILPLGVNLQQFYPLPIANNSPRLAIAKFLFVGHVNAQKGADLLLDACRQLSETRIRFEMVVVGSHSNSERYLRAQLRQYGKVLGRIPNDELYDIYHNASCLVLPSRFDSFGQVVAEAMACGLPVIVSDNVGAKDLVDNGKNGWVIPSGDPHALYQNMAEAAQHPERLFVMGKAARKTAEQNGWSVYRDRAARTLCDFLVSHG
jgi:glycosyltransferase involved in cell wall biosynthesis